MSVLSVDVLHATSQIILPRIEVRSVSMGRDCNCWFSVAVGRKDLRECVSHSKFAVESVAEEGLSWVKTSIYESMLGSRGERIVAIIIWKFGLEELPFGGHQPLHHLGRSGDVASARASCLALGHGSGMRWPLASTASGYL